jgi:hypothetical protein
VNFPRLAALGLLFAFSAPVSAQLTISGFSRLSASVSAVGTYSLTLPVNGWQLGGSLPGRPSNSRIESGTDNLGPYQDIAFDYTMGASNRTASIRAYKTRPLVMFSVTYLNASGNTAPFPSLSTYPNGLSHFAWNGMFAFPEFKSLPPDSPWVFFDNTAHTFVISPASDYMTASTTTGSRGEIQSGISSQIAPLPAGMTHRTLLAFGQGINSTLDIWGQALTDLASKQRPTSDADPLLNTISYWTDNGATYYYNPGGASYTDTLKAVKAEFDAKGIQLGSLQLDSWWYPKGPDDVWSSHGGIWTYSAAPGIFQPDLTTFQTGIAVPLTTHARWIDARSPTRSLYRMSGDVSTDPQYWEDVASYLKVSGVATYEQDWLGANAQTTFNLTDPAAFLDNMAASMAKRGITMQYCMALPKHFLQGTNYSNLTTIRTSGDGFGQNRWTEYLYGARLASALGEWPFSDVLMSTDRDSLILATLSAGPVGIGDPLGGISAENLLHAARPDGVIVKPDAPLTPLDRAVINDAEGSTTAPMIAATYSDFGGLRTAYIFAYTRGGDSSITIAPASYGIKGPAFLYDYLGGVGYLVTTSSSMTLNLDIGTGYFVLSPVGPSGIAFIGDKDQYVTLGKKRIAALTDNGQIDTKIAFAASEQVRTLFGYSPQPVAAVSLRGTVETPVWDGGSQTFTVRVHPSRAGIADVHIATALSGSSDAPVCGFRCAITPVSGPE